MTRHQPKTRLAALERREAARAAAQGAPSEQYDRAAAMRDATLAVELASRAGDAGALTRALALKSQLAGIDTEEPQRPFAGASEQELTDGIVSSLREAFSIEAMVAFAARCLEGTGYAVTKREGKLTR